MALSARTNLTVFSVSVSLLPRDCWLLESWDTAGARATQDLSLWAAPGDQDTSQRTGGDKDDTATQLWNRLGVEGSRENYRATGKHKTGGICKWKLPEARPDGVEEA